MDKSSVIPSSCCLLCQFPQRKRRCAASRTATAGNSPGTYQLRASPSSITGVRHIELLCVGRPPWHTKLTTQSMRSRLRGGALRLTRKSQDSEDTTRAPVQQYQTSGESERPPLSTASSNAAFLHPFPAAPPPPPSTLFFHSHVRRPSSGRLPHSPGAEPPPLPRCGRIPPSPSIHNRIRPDASAGAAEDGISHRPRHGRSRGRRAPPAPCVLHRVRLGCGRSRPGPLPS
jgi:hypothetical protein